jgi:integrase
LAADVVAAGHIADFLGHVGTRMTLKTYRHVLAPAVTAARTPMDRLIN